MSDPLGELLTFAQRLISHDDPDTADPPAWGEELDRRGQAARAVDLQGKVEHSLLEKRVYAVEKACLAIVLRYAVWKRERTKLIQEEVDTKAREHLNEGADEQGREVGLRDYAREACQELGWLHDRLSLPDSATQTHVADQSAAAVGNVKPLSLAAAAHALGKSEATVRRYVQDGKLTALPGSPLQIEAASVGLLAAKEGMEKAAEVGKTTPREDREALPGSSAPKMDRSRSPKDEVCTRRTLDEVAADLAEKHKREQGKKP